MPQPTPTHGQPADDLDTASANRAPLAQVTEHPNGQASAITHAVSWEALRALNAVLSHGSLSAAARALGSSQPTLSRHMAALETAWGVALFSRSTTGLRPTEAAMALAPLADTMAAQALAMERVVEAWRSPQVQGTVRLSASEVMGQLVLPPVLAKLQAEHPGIRLELALSNQLHNLLTREVDLAVRMRAPEQMAVLAQHVGDRPVGLYAHRSYLNTHGVPPAATDLLNHRLIGHDRDEPAGLAPAYAAIWHRAHFALRVDDQRTQWALLCAGAGIAPAMATLADAQPDLQRVLPEVEVTLPVWLCMHEDLRHSAAHMTVFRALVAGLRNV